MTEETSDIPSELLESLADEPWLILITTMVYERLKGAESIWRPYLDLLPRDFDTLMYWADIELLNLQGSAVVGKIGKHSADTAFHQKILPLIHEHSQVFQANNLPDEELLSLCHRMASTMMAYAFDLEKPESQRRQDQEDGWEEDDDEVGGALFKGMVPMADLLNADADRNNAKLFYEEDTVVMKSIKTIQSGEEIFNDYGPLPRADLLRRYGYLTDNYAKYDVVEVSQDLIVQVVKSELKINDTEVTEKLAYLEEQDILEDGYDLGRASNEGGCFPEELSILLNTLLLAKDEFEKLRKKEKLPKPNLPNPALEILCKILVERLSQYGAYVPDRADSDKGVLFSLQTKGDDPAIRKGKRRKMLALQIIAGEKVVLQEAWQEATTLLHQESKVEDFERQALVLRKSRELEEAKKRGRTPSQHAGDKLTGNKRVKTG